MSKKKLIERIKELTDLGNTREEIAGILNKEGYRTPRSNMFFTKGSVVYHAINNGARVRRKRSDRGQTRGGVKIIRVPAEPVAAKPTNLAEIIKVILRSNISDTDKLLILDLAST